MLLFILSFLAYLTSISSIDIGTHNYYWRDYVYRDVACDAYHGAPGKYIGQINFQANNLVATINPTSGVATAALGGMQSTRNEIKILCGPDHTVFYWENVDFNLPRTNQLQNAVKGGFQGQGYHTLFIGKSYFEDEWRIGKVHDYDFNSGRGLWIWNNNRGEVNIHRFSLLKYNVTGACSRRCRSIYV